MTIAEWLDSRTPPAPPRLHARLHAALRPWAQVEATAACEHCLTAAEDILRHLLADESRGRARALDLLAADALVTYAFEAASDEPDTLARCTEVAMLRIARLGAGAIA
ncbi:MAG TPA: hypothetical protein VFJ96_15020 [Gemmatimonadaceae bacterium]|jgi:hypothetical protein|nr:hypothetical protein [Gemmatimonadaceae bacterium]